MAARDAMKGLGQGRAFWGRGGSDSEWRQLLTMIVVAPRRARRSHVRASMAEEVDGGG